MRRAHNRTNYGAGLRHGMAPYAAKNNGNWLQRARALGLTMTDGGDGVQLVEEMLAVQLQCLMDGGGLSNFPRSSIGALVLLQALDQSDLEQPLEWLYDRSQERLRTFVSNNFSSDGTPPEATGGYNDTHSMGLFEARGKFAKAPHSTSLHLSSRTLPVAPVRTPCCTHRACAARDRPARTCHIGVWRRGFGRRAGSVKRYALCSDGRPPARTRAHSAR